MEPKNVAALTLVTLLSIYCGTSILALLLANLLVIVTLNYRFARAAVLTFPRDFKGVKTLLSIEYALKTGLRSNTNIGKLFAEHVKRYGDTKDAFVDIETNRSWTFNDVDRMSNRVAHYFHNLGYKKGDVVALYMNNCPEYACIWLGLSKLGVITALINFNLRSEPLGHSIAVAKAKSIITGADLQSAIYDVIDSGVADDIPIFVYGEVDGNVQKRRFDVKNLAVELEQWSPSALNVNNPPGFRDVLLYIYTSGTTGLPKAALISHCRYMMMASGSHHCYDILGDDRIYITMPMYHSAAGILGIGQTILHGSTCVIKKKFSASRFWEDCIKYQCTASQYIGEICRYLLAQPPKDTDSQHKVRLVYGNGLRKEIWKQFTDRFNIKKVGEFYGSTEGNASLSNLDSHVGACGFLPIYPRLGKLYPVCLLKVDPDTGVPVRDSRGLCMRCRPGESGEIVGRIIKGDPMKDFTGYVSGKDTNKKVIKDVFEHGDMAFASGDILYMDEFGYLYFKDRTGDTFRWKGENVSTNEVESVVHKAIGMQNDATVYGVAIPNMDGKAGMAALVDTDSSVDLESVQSKLTQNLPAYARPVFLRFCTQVDQTGTYKLKKTELQKAGYDLSLVNGDRLFYLNGKSGKYEPLTQSIYDEITRGNIKF